MDHNRRIDDPKPPSPAAELPPDMLALRAAIEKHFPLLQSLDWTSIGTAMRDFDKRVKAVGR